MSTLTFERNTLLNAINNVLPAVNNHQQPIYTHLLFEVKNNSAKITGTGNDIELSVDLDVQAPDMAFTVPAKKLADVLKASTADEAVFTLDNEQVKMKLGRGRFSLPSFDPNAFPAMPSNNTVAVKTLTLKADELLHLLNSTRFSMAKNDARYFLNGVKFETENNVLRAIATDGHRLALNEMEIKHNADLDFILPASNVEKLCALLKTIKDQDVDLALMDNVLKVNVNNITLFAKLIDGRFPDYRRVMPKNIYHVYSIDRNELDGVISRAKVLADDKFFGLRLAFKGNDLNISTTNTTAENSSELLDCVQVKGEDITLGLNGKYLSAILSQIDSENVEINIVDSSSSVLIKHNNACYIVMPMRL